MFIYLTNIEELIKNNEANYIYSSFTLNRLKKSSSLKRKNEIKATELLFSKIFSNLESFTIERTSNGKPYFKETNIKFSYSHSGSYLALMTDEIDVGVDIQEILSKTKKVAKGFLNDEEMKLPKSDLEYTLLWSVKESLIKQLDLTIFNAKEIKIKNCKKDVDEFLTEATYKDKDYFIRSKLFQNYLISYTSKTRRDLKIID